MVLQRFILGTVVLTTIILTPGCAGSTAAGGSGVPLPAPPEQQVAQVSPDRVPGTPASAEERLESTPTPPGATASGANDPANTAQPGQAGTSSEGFVSSQQAGDLQVGLKITPFPPQGRNASSLEVTLTDTVGRPVSDAQVGFDLTMPAMPMPPNHPTAQSAGDGRYMASARMLMPGEWWITVIIQRGNQQQTVKFTGIWVP